MASRAPKPSEAQLDAFVLQHLQARGFAGAASALRSEMAAPAPVADASRPALVNLLASRVRLKELYASSSGG